MNAAGDIADAFTLHCLALIDSMLPISARRVAQLEPGYGFAARYCARFAV